MWEAGVHSVFSLAPEARQLLDAIPECSCVGADDLVVRSVVDAGSARSHHWLKRYTGGIPALVRALPVDGNGPCANLLDAPAYLEGLQELVGKSLRLTLSDEELRLRLAIFLLGHGNKADLCRVAGCVSEEIVEGMRSSAPLFEIGVSTFTFSCPLDAEDALLRVCRSHLSAACAIFPDVCEAAIDVLDADGRYGRIAELIGLPGSQRGRALLLLRAPLFIDVGAVEPVKLAAIELAPYQGMGLGEGFIRSLNGAVTLLGERAVPRALTLERARELVDAGSTDLDLFAESRRFLRAERANPVESFEELDALGRRLLVHREICDLMAEGRFSAATRLIVANPCPHPGSRVSDALLAIDSEAARLLLCDVSGEGVGQAERAARLLSASGLAGLGGYADCLGVIRAIVSPGKGADMEFDLVATRAERAGDRLVQVVSLIGGAVSDLRRGALARATVRAELAAAVASGSGLEYLARVCRLLGEVARFMLGELPGTGREAARGDDLGRVSALARAAMLVEEDEVVSGPEGDSEPPRDAMWMLLVLEDGMGTLSNRIRAMMPPSWRHAISLVRPRRNAEAPAVPRPPETRQGHELDRVRDERQAPIEIRLLGEFSMTVRGKRVPESELDHRNVKSMLEYLILRRGATAKRYQLVEQVWPDADYGSGFNRAYQATSSLRAAISRIDGGLDPFILSRTSKAVSLDMSIIRCDVDEFRRCAREASDSADDETAVRMARRAESLYVGDLYIPPVDATGYVMAAREELRRLYGDAMVAGSDAALRLGKKRTATRLAMNALSVDDMREDAVVSMVRALRSSGRNVEADRQYQRYARKLMQTASRPPSRLLRRAAGLDEGRVGRAGETYSDEIVVDGQSRAS